MSSHGYTGSSGSKTSKPNVPERPPDINTPLNATIRQEGDEPLAEADMDWQATMKVSESKEAARRWYFKTQRTEFAVLGSDKPLRPKAVQSGDIWQAKLQLENVPIGWYWLVFCVSLKDMDLGSVESITFDARTGDAEGQPYCMENLIKTKLSKEDIQEIPKEDFVRLRLHRQIKYLPQYSYFYPDIAIETTAGTEVPVSFDLHYVELGSADFRSSSKVKDHVLYGNDAPDRFIRVGASCTEPIGVRAFDFSDTGAYAATLYLTTGKAHIQIWNLRTPDKKKRTPGKPQPLTLPCAQTSFDVSEVISDPFSIVDCFFSVAISSSGSKVAICSNEERDHAVSCTLFKYNPTAPVDHDLSKPWPLKRATLEICSNLVGTFGEIAFRGIDARDPKEQDERFFKFDGFTLEVYNTYNKWERLFVLTTKIDRMARDCLAKAVFHSIRGRRLVYTGVSGLVSIWDFEAGKVVSNISVPEDDAVVKAILSHDGSMVAIAVKKSVHVYDVISRIRLGVFKEGQDKNNELDFGQAYFMTLNYAASTSPYGEPPNARSIVRLSDMSIVSTFMLYEEYSLQTPQQNGEPIFAFDQGSILNLKGFGSIILPKEAEQCDSECELGQELAIHQFADGWTSVFTQITDNTTFRITASDKLVAVKSITVLQITVEDTEGVTVKSADIPMGAARIYHCGFYVPESSQLFILAGCYLQVWNISTTSSELCELAYIWKLREDDPKHATDFSHRTIESASVCPHGRQIQVTVSPNLWLDANANVIGDVTGVPNDLLTVPMSADDSIKLSEQYRIVNGVQYLPILYAGADLSVKRAIIRYLRKCVRPTPKHPESSLVTLCRMWSPENKSILEAMMGELLSAKNISWLPDVNAVKTNDPLAILLEIARTMPSVIAVVKIISAYCVSHANRNKNLAFMAPVFGSMHELMQIFPGEALECMNGISYIPARERSFLMDNHIVSYSPKARMQFWKDEKKPLAELKNPILQMHESVSEPDPRNQNFTLPIFVAAFDALWNYKDDTKSKSKQEALAKTARRNGTTWWKTLYHMIAVKLHLWSHTYVEGHNFTLEFFDNPAIAALVAYKWNTIGFMYWSTRFFFQFIFYILVTTAALMQVYHHGLAQRDLVGIFISIIVFGAVFLWFELLQAVKNWSRYTNIYNFLDMVAYTVPVAASIDQLMILYRNDTTGNARILSFSVLAIFVHMLFELRINKSVCKYVTIIQETVAEIRVFFFIFAGGILAFTIATLHLLRACPVLGECGEPTTKFSGHIVGALSATYFFMGGRYDPVNDELDSNDWGFHSMMVIYFFFTVIVMLNVLIALINVAFLRGDENWRLVWIESRLRYIESAENMSYHIPGFRQSHNWFPREIFYSATLEEVKAYRKRQQSRTNADEDRDLLKDLGRDEDDDEVDDRQGCLLTHKVEPSKVLLASDGNTTTRSIRGSIRADERKPNEGLGRRERSPTEDTMLKNAYYGNANERRHPSNNQKNQVENGANLSQNENQHQDDSSASVGELKKQVVQLQKQMTEQLKAQQQMHEQSQKQLQELRELFFRGNSALGLD